MGERKACDACGTALVGALTLNGSVAPIEVNPSPDGNIWLGLGPWKVPTPDGPLVVDGPGPHEVVVARRQATLDDPVDAEVAEVAATREVRSMVLSGEIVQKARAQGMSLHRNHHATCPDAARFRR